jgi:DNA polymerase iota
LFCLNRASLSSTFFHLSKSDPENGFICDLTSFAGCVEGGTPHSVNMEVSLCVQLLLASHLAYFLRMKLEEEFGFTSTCGVSTNKLLSKLVGSKNKPKNQTTLLALDDEAVFTFIDSHVIRKIPGIGSKISRMLEAKLRPDDEPPGEHTMESRVLVHEARTHPDIYPASLELLLAGPGSERGIGEKVWGYLHGVDPSDIKAATEIPSQISIEDSYRSLESSTRITEELHKLSMSLIRRMRLDLLVDDDNPHRDAPQRWLAKPKTLRLSIGTRPPPGSDAYMSRTSRSAPLPGFVFSVKDDIDDLADRLVGEAVLPLLRKFQTGGEHKWDLSLLNVCVANMVPVGSEVPGGSGRDIAVMFKTQDEVLKPFRVENSIEKEAMNEDGDGASQEAEWDVSWEGQGDGDSCSLCGYYIPPFAMEAHLRYHELGD